MGKKNKGTRRGVQIAARQNRMARINKHTIAKVVKQISDHLYFYGSHSHQLDTLDWNPILTKLVRHEDQQTALKSMVGLLSEKSPWQLLLFVGVETDDALELFSFLETFKDHTYVNVSEPTMDYIEARLADIKQNISEEALFKDTQLTLNSEIKGFGYYLFNSSDYNLEGSEDEIADLFYESGVFDLPYDPSNYQRVERKHFSDMFKRQELRLIKDKK